jgi:hypothetical protein
MTGLKFVREGQLILEMTKSDIWDLAETIYYFNKAVRYKQRDLRSLYGLKKPFAIHWKKNVRTRSSCSTGLNWLKRLRYFPGCYVGTDEWINQYMKLGGGDFN